MFVVRDPQSVGLFETTFWLMPVWARAVVMTNAHPFREIRYYQVNTAPLVPKPTFQRLVRKGAQDFKTAQRLPLLSELRLSNSLQSLGELRLSNNLPSLRKLRLRNNLRAPHETIAIRKHRREWDIRGVCRAEGTATLRPYMRETS